MSLASAGDGVGCLRRREGGGGIKWRLWNWVWIGIGSHRGWAVVGRTKKKSLNRDRETLYWEAVAQSGLRVPEK